VLIKNINPINRQAWLKSVLGGLPARMRILDAGAGQLQNRQHCTHLDYVSQDFCQYTGAGDERSKEGQHTDGWDTTSIDLVSDITDIPEPDASFDAILCSEVLELVPEPTHALDEFARLLKPGEILIITAPFGSNVHMAPYHFCTGFSRYWYEYHLPERNFRIELLKPNGCWYSLFEQELSRLRGLERQQSNWTWPLEYLYELIGVMYFKIRSKKLAEDLACFGYFCIVVKKFNH
jgi:SAM-dependent methyltransferase